MPCPVDGCDAEVKSGQLMCRGHWFATPKPLQQAVNRTWRNFKRDPFAYREARDKALAFHKGRLDPAAQAELF